MRILFTLCAFLGFLNANAQRIFLKVNQPIFNEGDATNISSTPGLDLSDYIELTEASVAFYRPAGQSGRNQKGSLTIKILEQQGLHSLPHLIESKLLGNVHLDGEIIFTNEGERRKIYQKYKFSEFLIAGTEKEFSDESELIIDIFFQFFEQTNYSFNDSGTVKETKSFGWDFERDRPW
ncbi:hypothetical protein [uncultured Arcticibacterium sp.]|uniref:hypothetical protein n=1 Tax=uncultured Arcticibacterium sp. TaxID=2173042 RepID=UPI0030FA2BC8